MRLLFVAGDLSGDEHASRVARAIALRHPNWQLHAVGGARLRAVALASPGGSVVSDTTGCSVIGFGSVIALLPRMLLLRGVVDRFLRRSRPDGVLLCDWGAFNGRLLPELKRLGIPVLYYFPPRSWQREGSAGTGIAPFVTKVATPFPWSAQRLQAVGCDAEWVGHPALETVAASPGRAATRRELGIGENDYVIGLFPGSRAMELKYIAPHIIGAAVRLRESRPTTFLMAIPPEAVGKLAVPKWIRCEVGRATEVLRACDAAIVKSGTITLEAAVNGAPQVVVYEGPPVAHLQWRLAGGSKKLPLVAMPNIILGRMAVQELLAEHCRAEPIARAVEVLRNNAGERERVLDDYAEVRRYLGSELPCGATERTATLLEEMVGVGWRQS